MSYLDLKSQYLAVNGTFHLPPATVCGPCIENNLESNWTSIHFEFTGNGPFTNPFLIIERNNTNEQHLAIPLKPEGGNLSVAKRFQVIISNEKIQNGFFILPSLQRTEINSIQFELKPINRNQAIIELAKILARKPKVILKSLILKNAYFCYQIWPKRTTLKTRINSLIELFALNMPDPNSFGFGIDPDYMEWINSNYETLVPRSTPLISKSHSNLVSLISFGSENIEDLALTVNSLLSAGFALDNIVVVNSTVLPEGYLDNRLQFSLETNLSKYLDRFGGGLYLLPLSAGDLVSKDLYQRLLESNLYPGPGIIYFDEDKVNEFGEFYNFEFKPDVSPTTLLFNNYIGNAILVSFDHLKKLVASDPTITSFGIDQQFYAFSLQSAFENKSSVAHISMPLIHTRYRPQTEQDSRQINDQSVREAFCESIMPDLEIATKTNSTVNWRSKSSWEPKVSIIIPTRDHKELLDPAIKSILRNTSYQNYEIVVINNQSSKRETLDYFDELSQKSNVSIVHFDEEFNYAKMHNQVIPGRDTEYILLLNNDIEIIDRNWLSNLMSLFSIPNIGIIGNKLLYPDMTMQHFGAIGGLRGPMSHHLVGIPDSVYNALTRSPRDILAVTAACMLISKHDYIEVKGMDENLAISYNDMDLCLRVRSLIHKSVIVSNSGGVIHKESKSRGKVFTKLQQELLDNEAAYFDKKWQDYTRPDPFYNQNYSLSREYLLR